MAHWTSESNEAFIHRITFDFLAQLEKRIEALDVTQAKLARKLAVSEGAVSQVLNNERDNLHLKTIVSYARALGMKVAIVAYDDQDPRNDRGPVGSEIFTTCWEKIGRPRDIWSLNNCISAATNRVAQGIGVVYGYPYRGLTEWANSTSIPVAPKVTVSELSLPIMLTDLKEGNTSYARAEELPF